MMVCIVHAVVNAESRQLERLGPYPETAIPWEPYSDRCFSPHSLHLNSPRCSPAAMVTRFGAPHFAHLTSLRLSSCLTVSLRSIASFNAASDWARSSSLVSVTCFLYFITTPTNQGATLSLRDALRLFAFLKRAPGDKPTNKQRKSVDVRFGSFASFCKWGEHVRFAPNSRHHSRRALRSALGHKRTLRSGNQFAGTEAPRVAANAAAFRRCRFPCRRSDKKRSPGRCWGGPAARCRA